jgi:DeoR family suf operon transcriptional repressor
MTPVAASAEPAEHGPPVPAVSSAQRSVVTTIRRRGEATVDEIAATLDMTPSGARQHLAALSDAGLVESAPTSRPTGGRGRPPQVWRTTAAADPLFPKAYGELTNELLGYLDDATVTDVFIRRRDNRVEDALPRLARCRSLGAKVTELAAILDRDGYLADSTQVERDTWLITEHNCAIQAVATTRPQACRSELEFLRTVLPEAEIERTSHIVAGQPCCAYRVVRRPRSKIEAS